MEERAVSLDNYEPVAVRIDKFWKTHPNGRIITDLVEFSGERVIARAEIYTDREDTRPPPLRRRCHRTDEPDIVHFP